MVNLVALRAANASRWQNANLTRGPEFAPVAVRLVAAKQRYLAVSAETGVPWFIIAVIHEREASGRWNANIAQGDSWDRRSVHVPAGRGPFASWDDAAYDALVNCQPYASRNLDWSAGGALTLLETYNGLGYAMHGLPSPYCWSGTDQYSHGKYVADGVFDSNAVDKQLGCAGLILAMQAIDPTIQFGGAVTPIKPLIVAQTGAVVVAPHPASVSPSISNPAPGSVGAKLAGWFASLFSRKA